MTLTTEIQAVEQEPFPELYEFVTGTGVDRYTSYSEDLTFQGFTYTAVPIKRSGISTDTKFGSVSVRLTATITDTLQRYIANQPIESVQVTIYRALYSDMTDYHIIFKGAIRNVQIENRVASVTCDTRSTLLDSRLPTIVYQSFCNHDLYDEGCGLDYTNFRISATVQTVNADGSLVIPGCAGWGKGSYFSGGKVEKDNDFRLITEHDEEDIVIHVPFDDRVVAGTSVFVYPGCDGDPDTCMIRFNNFSNFLGFPYIPSHNPVAWGFK